MTRATSIRLRAAARRYVRELAFDIAVEKNPDTRKELQRQHARALDALEFAEREVVRASEQMRGAA